MVRYIFRPSSPFCPLAVALGLAIPEAVPQVEDVARQEIEVQGYVGAQALNEFRTYAVERNPLYLMV